VDQGSHRQLNVPTVLVNRDDGTAPAEVAALRYLDLYDISHAV
jgi:hypothetical protein